MRYMPWVVFYPFRRGDTSLKRAKMRPAVVLSQRRFRLIFVEFYSKFKKNRSGFFILQNGNDQNCTSRIFPGKKKLVTFGKNKQGFYERFLDNHIARTF